MRSIKLQLLSLIACAAVAMVAAGQDPPQAKISAGDAGILKRIRDTYAQCESYRDKGEVQIVFVRDGVQESPVLKPFTTAFVRPGRFRFEFRSHFEFRGKRGDENSYVVWTDKDVVYRWLSTQSGIEVARDLGVAIAGATGVSSGSAYVVPSMLMPDLVGGKGVLSRGARVLGGDVLNGFDCYKIESPLGATLWFDKEELMLRRMIRVRVFEGKGFSTETTTNYQPELNGEVSDSDLSFEPPPK